MTQAIPFDLSYGRGAPLSPHEAIASELLVQALKTEKPYAKNPPLPEEVPPEDLVAAITAWENLLGREHVFYDKDTLDRYSRCTLPWSTRPSAVLRPDGTKEVSELVKIAHRYRIPLHPISRGKNWGYGDACAPTDGQVIVDLGRMNRILEVNEELAYAVIEPGVTQGQLFDYLAERQLKLMVPVHGGGPDCSLIGNALQRGFGVTPITDHFSALSSVNAVLPDGTVYKSPLIGKGAVKSARVFKWGVGAFIDGVFSQSRLGIVTEASILLAAHPDWVEGFFFAFGTEQLPSVADAVRRVMRSLGTNCGAINLMNDRRVLAMTVPFPREKVQPGKPIPQKVVDELASREAIAPWTGAGALYGNPALVRAARQTIRRELKPHVRMLVTANESSAARWSTFLSLFPMLAPRILAKRLATVRSFLRIAAGQPQKVALPLANWKIARALKETAIPDSVVDGSGLIWYAPLIPLLGTEVGAFCKMATTTCLEVEFDPLITLTCLSDRVVDCTLPILFDPRQDHERIRATTCYRLLLERGNFNGWTPYRYSSIRLESQ